MKAQMVQNTKLMTMLEANLDGKGEEASGKSPGSGKLRRQKRTCKNVVKKVYMRMMIVSNWTKTKISIQHGTRMDMMVWGLGVVIWR